MILKNLNPQQIEILSKIGGTLKEKREARQIAVESVAEIIRISSSTLHSLENAEYEEFDSLIFVRGFLRNYCKFLGIESDWMIREINQIYEDKDHNLDVKIKYDRQEEQKNDDKNKNHAYVFVAVLSFILVLSAGGYAFYNYYLFNPDLVEKVPQIQLRNDSETEAPSATQTPVAISKLSLELKAQNEGWVRIELDEDEKIEAWLKAGFSYQWEADSRIEIIMDQGSLALVFFNGEQQRVAPEFSNRLVRLLFERDADSGEEG